jgi:hypothetical protein
LHLSAASWFLPALLATLVEPRLVPSATMVHAPQVAERVAPPIDFNRNLKEIDGQPMAKRGRMPGITNNPRLKRVSLK